MIAFNKSKTFGKLVEEGRGACTSDVKPGHIKSMITKIAAMKMSANQRISPHEVKNTTPDHKDDRKEVEIPPPDSKGKVNIPPKIESGD